ncbi:MAG: heme-binding protein, partial [Gemmataceae bacterium]
MRLTVILVIASFSLADGSASAAEPPLQSQLASEPVADLAKASRERGDAGRGAVLFFQPFLSCAKCHDGDAQLGPDIAKAGKEATAEHLVESVLFPSKVVKKGFETIVVTTKDERTITGLLVGETGETLTMLDPAANGKRVV